MTSYNNNNNIIIVIQPYAMLSNCIFFLLMLLRHILNTQRKRETGVEKNYTVNIKLKKKNWYLKYVYNVIV